MKTTFDRTSVFSLAAALVLCGAAFAGRYVAAEEKKSPVPTYSPPQSDAPDRTHDVQLFAELVPTYSPQQSVAPILSKIPFLSRLFKNTNADGFERIGVDFEFLGAACQQCVAQETCKSCEAGCPKQCEQCDLLCVRPFEICVEACDEDDSDCESRDDLPWTLLLTLIEDRRDFFHVVERIRREQLEREDGLHEALLDTSLVAAAAQATLETRIAFAEKETRLREELAQAKMENVLLAAKLEVSQQKEKLAAEILKMQLVGSLLQSENAQLKEQLASHETRPGKRSRAVERTAKKPVPTDGNTR